MRLGSRLNCSEIVWQLLDSRLHAGYVDKLCKTQGLLPRLESSSPGLNALSNLLSPNIADDFASRKSLRFAFRRKATKPSKIHNRGAK